MRWNRHISRLVLMAFIWSLGTSPLGAAPVSLFPSSQIRLLPETDIAVLVSTPEIQESEESLHSRLQKTWSGLKEIETGKRPQEAVPAKSLSGKSAKTVIAPAKKGLGAETRKGLTTPKSVPKAVLPTASPTVSLKKPVVVGSSNPVSGLSPFMPASGSVSVAPQPRASDTRHVETNIASVTIPVPVAGASPGQVVVPPAACLASSVPVVISSKDLQKPILPEKIVPAIPSGPAKAKDPEVRQGFASQETPIPEGLGSVSFAIIEPEDASVASTTSALSSASSGPAIAEAVPAVALSGTPGSVQAASPTLESAPPPAPFPEPLKEEPAPERSLNISGSKTFEMKNAKVKGDIGHFSTENFESIPGFRLDQSLHLEIEGNISRHTSVNAVLDDKQDEDRRFTVFVDGSSWDLTLGDFPMLLKNTEFLLYNKEVRGILAEGQVTSGIKTMLLFSQSKGRFRREQFRGAGQQQEFRLLGRPVVQNSERISIDGRVIQRGSEYLIDYEDGVLKLTPALLPIEVTSWIVVEYEVSDSKMAFKRNLYGVRVEDKLREDRVLALSWLREMDGSTPKSENNASGTARPVDHQVIGIDGSWQLKPWLGLNGELAWSLWDPNHLSELTPQDQEVKDKAGRLNLSANRGPLVAELALRRIGSGFKQIGREEGATVLGERGLVNDILKETGRVTYRVRPDLSFFGGLEDSRTNVSHDPSIPEVKFQSWSGGGTWKYRPKSQFESRWETQRDQEDRNTPFSDREKTVGTLVWDHDFGKVFTQTKLEQTGYEDALNAASGSKVLNLQSNISGAQRKGFAWTAGVGHVRLDDDLDPNKIRSVAQNYTVDLTFDPSRMFNARGIFQWRRETDYLTTMQQDDQVADSRIRYQPFRDLNTQFKYKVENTTKVVRDPSLDPTKFVRPPSLPVTKSEQEEVVGRFENPVQKRTANFNAAYRFNQKAETNIDWKWRDLRDRATHKQVSYNDRKAYELKFAPMAKIQLTTGYEDGLLRNLAPATELRDTIRRLEMRNEFKAGYILTSRLEDHREDDVLANENDKRTEVRGADFSRVFSSRATMELGLNRNIITFRDPSREWEKRAAFIFTPSSRNQRYKFFVTHRSIEAAKPGNYLEGGLNFSQFIGTDTMLDGEIKKVTSSAAVNGTGYEATVANAKMVITF